MSEALSAGRTLPKYLLKNRDRWGGRAVALRAKEHGIWQAYSWADCCEKTKAISLGLKGLGLKAGTPVCILGRNSPEWLWCEMAVQAAGGIVTAVGEGLSAEDTERLMGEAGVELALAEGQEQVDRLLGLKSRLPQLKRVVCWRARGAGRHADPALLSLEEVMTAGGDYGKRHAGDFEASVAGGRNHDVAIQLMALRSGRLRPVPVTHEFVISFAEAASARGWFRGRTPPEYVAGNDPCWFFEQALGYGMCLTVGQILNFPESSDTVNRDFREISPRVVVRRPPEWDATASAIKRNVGDTTRLKRALCRFGLSAGHQVAIAWAQGGRPGVIQRLRHKGADLVVLGPLRDKHGLNRVWSACVGGGVAAGETRLLLGAIGVDLREIYCSTRDGLMTADPGDEVRLG